jgi:hypothetical protein
MEPLMVRCPDGARDCSAMTGIDVTTDNGGRMGAILNSEPEK